MPKKSKKTHQPEISVVAVPYPQRSRDSIKHRLNWSVFAVKMEAELNRLLEARATTQILNLDGAAIIIGKRQEEIVIPAGLQDLMRPKTAEEAAIDRLYNEIRTNVLAANPASEEDLANVIDRTLPRTGSTNTLTALIELIDREVKVHEEIHQHVDSGPCIELEVSQRVGASLRKRLNQQVS